MVVTKKSFCRFCHIFCGLELDIDVEKNRIVSLRGDRENASSQGFTCVKGRAELERLYHPERLLSSKKRCNGEFVDIDAEQALDEIAQKLRAIIDQYGPRAVAVYAGDAGHRMSTSGPWFLRKWLDALGSPGLYTSFTVDSPSLVVAAQRFFGALMPFSLFDMANADVAMLIGANPVVSHMLLLHQSNAMKRLRDARKRGMKLIVVDPRRCDVARLADIHLQVKPGEDATLLAAMIKVILEQKLYDKEYVAKYASGLDELCEAVRPFELDYAASRTQVPADLIQKAAVMFATAPRGAVQTGTGLAMARHQNLSNQLAMTINGLCGRYDRRGGLTCQPGVLGPAQPENREPIPLPLHTDTVSRVRGIKAMYNWLGIEEMPSNCLADEIQQPGDGKVRALIVHGGNPALVFPDEEGTIKALKSLDLLVVTDLFMSATAKHAHYVLASRHPFERTDIPRLMDAFYPFPFMQYTPPMVNPPDGVLQGFEIFWGLAKRLGMNLDIPGISLDCKPTADEMLDGLNYGSRIPMDEIRKYPGGRVYGDRDPNVGGIIPNMIGHPDKRMALGHPEVIEELREVRAEPVMQGGGYEAHERYAYRMITYRMEEVYCTQGQNLPSLRKLASYNPVLMNADDMHSLGVKDGDVVNVTNQFGSLEGIVKSSKDLNRGVIGLAHGWGDPADPRGVREKGSNVQRLIPDDYRYDRVTGLALMSGVPVNVTATRNQ